MSEHFIKRWESEYLIELREFHKTKSNKKDKRVNQINVGDVVLIHEENTSKVNFKLDIIDSFKPSRIGAKKIANVPGPNLEKKGMCAIFQKKGKKRAKKG